MKFILQLLTWWDGQSLGTRLFTWRKGKLVGEDNLGNKYYTYKAKRWVIYNGAIEGSRVSPEWHGWLHHTFDNMPNDNPLPQKPWQKPHQENLTGTDAAYHPKGSILMAKPAKRSDYDAWQPE